MNICTSGSLTAQACTKPGRISLHNKERMTENTEQLRLLRYLSIYVLLHSECFPETPGYGLFTAFFLCQNMVAQNDCEVDFGTHHCYCDDHQVIILLCFPEIAVTLFSFLVLNCIVHQSIGKHP